MKIETLMLGMMDNRCYLVSDEDTKECVLIDPSFDTPVLTEAVKKAGNKLKYIMLTHRHFDHVLGTYSAAKISGAKVVISEPDACGLENEIYSLADQINQIQNPVKPDILLNDGDEIVCGSMKFKTLFTPGHTVGSVCYICDDVIFSGDTLFKRSIGRTDLPTGSYIKMAESLKKIADLPGDYRIFPGHGDQTTLDYERAHNPYIREVL